MFAEKVEYESCNMMAALIGAFGLRFYYLALSLSIISTFTTPYPQPVTLTSSSSQSETTLFHQK